MAPTSSSSRLSSTSSGSLTWRPTKIMNMRDLSKDDDFLSHLLVEKLGTGTVPLLVHKMDSSRRLPKTDTQDLMRIVRRLVASKAPLQQVVRQAVDELLMLPPIRYYLKIYTQKQINAFATHASRYFELYHPSGCIEIAHTSRYSHRTGKSELCILATRPLAPGFVVAELKGSMANLTDEEDKELKRTDLRNSDIRRDFSVIHSKSMKKNHLFLGPARFVNHDCDNNCELFREGRYITFRVLKPIAVGEEITAHYGDGYFGKKNRHCLCATCEKNGKGGYSPDHQEDDDGLSSDSSSGSSDSDSDSDTSSSDSDSDEPKPVVNLNERRTRRGVYAITRQDTDDSDNDEEEDDEKVPLANAEDVPTDGEIELMAEMDIGSDLTSLATSLPPSDGPSPSKLSTPDRTTPARVSRSSSSLTELTSSAHSTPKSTTSTPARSIISTRRQKVRELEAKNPSRCSAEPSPKRITRSASSLMLSEKSRKGKGKATPTPVPTPRPGQPSGASAKDEVKVKKEDAETRVLRARQSIVGSEVSKEPSPKKEIPRGPDGKPLPTCSTCLNVLPLISVDSKVVWGLGIDTNKKRKNQKLECPRCMRHSAIYSQPWPVRLSPHGTLSITPREESVPVESLTNKVTHKGLKVLDRKLAAAVQSKTGKKRGRDDEEEETETLSKRRKSMPEPIVQKPKITKTYSSNAKKAKRPLSPSPEPVEDIHKRGRGRPRLSLPDDMEKNSRVKIEETPTEIPKRVFSQPRALNGRFGRKDKALKRTRSQGSLSPNKGYNMERGDTDETVTSSRRKRSNDAMDEAEESPRKKGASLGEIGAEEQLSLVGTQKFVPRPLSGFRGGRLFSNPNPLRFARYAWSAPVILDDSSSSDEEKHPETPDDSESLGAGIVASEEEPVVMAAPVASMIPRAPLIYKPTPFTFAKRYWNQQASVRAPCNGNNTLNIPETHSDEEDEIPYKAPVFHKTGRYSPVSDCSSPLSDDPPRLQHIYPVIPPSTAASGYIPKSSHFPSLNLEIKPTFINAGWDDSSDTSEP